MKIDPAFFYFGLSFAFYSFSIAMACLASIRFVRIYPAWSSAVESTTGNTWLNLAYRLPQSPDWAHPSGTFVIFTLAALFGIASGVQIIFGGFAETASLLLESNDYTLIHAPTHLILFPLGTAMAVYHLGKAAAPSTSPIRLAMAEFDSLSRQRDIAIAERSSLELDIPNPLDRPDARGNRRL